MFLVQFCKKFVMLFVLRVNVITFFHSMLLNSSATSSSKGPVPNPAPSVAPRSQAQVGQGRLQHDSIAGPPPMRYVNYLAYQGYSVEIIGGKHYKTPDGEFVEMKSGTQYKIHVKNSHAYSKDGT